MPHERVLLGNADGLKVEKVRFLRHAGGEGRWSPVYRPEGARLVLPVEGCVDVRTGGGEFLADPLTAWFLDDGEAYRLGALDGRERANVVVSGTRAGRLPREAPMLLAPRALFLLRCHWKALREGRAAGGETLRLLQAARLGAGIPAGDGVAGRARRFLAAGGAGASLDQVAEELRTSPFHLARSFRQSTGLGLHQYRTRLRVAAAIARLEKGEGDLAGLAHDLGFAHQSHFGEVFRRLAGVTPGQARAALA